jgi:hypothetical protein
MRTCKRCLKPKEDSEFGVNRWYRDRRAIYCKECNRRHMARQRERAFELLRNTKVKVSMAALGYK